MEIGSSGAGWKRAVATPGDLPAAGSVGDERKVLDDGDGKTAVYGWNPTTVAWEKQADPDGGGGGGSGDVTGPSSAVDNTIVRFNGTTGKIIQAGSTQPTIDDSGNIGLTALKTVDGRDVSVDGAALDAHIANTSNPHSVTAAQAGADPTGTASAAVSTHVGLADPHTQYALESALGTASTLASDTDGTLAANSDTRIATQKAVKTYVDASVTGLLDFKGGTDCSSNPNYPAASKGDAYYVTVAGKIGGASGKSVDVGDVYVASADNAGGTEASVGTSWFVLEHNLVGALLAANNLSDIASASSARGNLGLAIGTNVQAWDADLDAVAALSSTGIVDRTGTSTWTTRPNAVFGLTDGASIGWDVASGRNASVTVAGNRTFDAPSNIPVGFFGSLRITQDGNGGRVSSFNAVFKFEGGITPELSSAAGAVDTLVLFFESSSIIRIIAVVHDSTTFSLGNLADGQIDNAAVSAVYTVTAGKRGEDVVLRLFNTNAATQTVDVYLNLPTAAGGSASNRQISKLTLTQNQAAVFRFSALPPGAVIKGQTTTASAVDYTVDGSEKAETVSHRVKCADGQLANAKGTLYTVSTGYAGVATAYVFNTTGAETVKLWEKPGSTSRQLVQTTLNANQALEMELGPLSTADLFEGSTTTATTVNYVVIVEEILP